MVGLISILKYHSFSAQAISDPTQRNAPWPIQRILSHAQVLWKVQNLICKTFLFNQVQDGSKKFENTDELAQG